VFELHMLPLDDDCGTPERVLVYRPRTGTAFVGNRAMAALARAASRGETTPDRSAEALTFLDRIGFLAPDPPPLAEPDPEFRPLCAVLLLTNRCSLRCVYCYASAGETTPEVLDPAVGRVVIDHVSDLAESEGREYFDLCLHGGGEPTQAWPVLRECVEYARQQPVAARITMTSNGIWSSDRLDWVTANLNSLTLSLDGAPATQDRQRPFVSGHGSAVPVLRTAAELDRRGFTYALRLTAVTPFDGLVDDVRYLCETTSCPVMHVEPAFPAGRGGRSSAGTSPWQSFAEEFVVAARVARQAGRSLEFSGAGLTGELVIHCSAPYESLIVTPSGRLVTCYEVTTQSHPLAELSTIGHVDGDCVVIDNHRRQTLHARLSERRAHCADCWCRRTCAGDCYVRAIRPGEGGHLARSARCDLNRTITRALLLDMIAADGGVWRRPEPGADLP
jgi:uncharacterized protein